MEGRTLRGQINITFTMIMVGLLLLLGGILIPERFINEQEVRKNRISMLADLLGENEAVKEALYEGEADEELIELLDSYLSKYKVDFIVLAQLDGRRVYHPYHERIGQYFVGGDEAGILEGKDAYISVARGTEDKQQRAFYNVRMNGESIGFVMVSMSLASIHREQFRLIGQLVLIILATMGIGILALSYVADRIQTILLGYEPEEFADIYKQGEQTLRASTHEFLNKMHVVSGLLQMGNSAEAQRYIGIVTNELEVEQGTIVRNIQNPTVSALLLGKLSRAKELDVQFSVRSDSRLQRHSPFLSSNDMITIIGNLVENAFDAVKNCDGTRSVEVFIGESEEGLTISVDDTGEGMTDKQIRTLQKKAFTTKGKGHGTGLRLIRGIVRRREGYLEIESEPGVGSSFTVSFNHTREIPPRY